MKTILLVLFSFCGGTLSGYFLLRWLLPPIISRALSVRERYNKLKIELEEIRKRIRNRNVNREELIDAVDAYWEKYGGKDG